MQAKKPKYRGLVDFVVITIKDSATGRSQGLFVELEQSAVEKCLPILLLHSGVEFPLVFKLVELGKEL